METINFSSPELEPICSGNLFIVSGFTGAGKDTIVQNFLSQNKNSQKIISYTTRPMRNGETEGLDYKFIDNIEFEKMLLHEEFIDYISVKNGGNSNDVSFYGTCKKDLLLPLKGTDIFWCISIESAGLIDKAITSNFDSTIAKILLKKTKKILIDVPRLTTCKDRVRKREVMSKEVFLNRLRKQYKNYMYYKDCFDMCIINDNLEVAVNEFARFVEESKVFERPSNP